MPNDYVSTYENSVARAIVTSGAPARVEEFEAGAVEAVVRQLLISPEPVAVASGRDLLALHNDPFATIIGTELRPDGVARPLAHVCAPLWPRVAPLVDRTLRTGESAALDNQLLCRFRDGSAEEAYLRFACRPLLDEDGTIAGVVVSVADQTEHVISLRRTAALRDLAAAAAPKCSVAQACRRAIVAVARHASDVPFALFYWRKGTDSTLRLVATAGVAPRRPASPELIDLETVDESSHWPIAAAMQANRPVIVDDLLNRFGTLPAGDWPFAPRTAVVVPVTSPGRDAPEGIFICGVSGRHALDAPYLAFIDLVANQIAAAIAGGRVYEEEERSAKARVAARIARAKRRARLRALKARFAGAFEERTRLAREIHDTLLQGVAGIALQLRAVLPDVRTAPESAAEVLKTIVALAERTTREARDAVWDMRPVTHAKRDLARTLEATARRLTDASAIQLHVSVRGHPRALAPFREAAVVRIVQEAIANAMRHAHPKTIRVRLAFDRQRLRVLVVDDGCGFAVAKDFHTYEGHWGLLGMMERAHSLGGVLTVRSTVGRGTAVMLRLPQPGGVRRRLDPVD